MATVRHMLILDRKSTVNAETEQNRSGRHETVTYRKPTRQLACRTSLYAALPATNSQEFRQTLQPDTTTWYTTNPCFTAIMPRQPK